MLQLEMDQEDSWYTLQPGIVHQDQPARIGPQDINPVASHTFTGSQDAGMYTHNELKGFWNSILINAASKTVLKNFSQNLIVYSTAPRRNRRFSLSYPTNRILCGENDFAWVF